MAATLLWLHPDSRAEFGTSLPLHRCLARRIQGGDCLLAALLLLWCGSPVAYHWLGWGHQKLMGGMYDSNRVSCIHACTTPTG